MSEKYLLTRNQQHNFFEATLQYWSNDLEKQRSWVKHLLKKKTINSDDEIKSVGIMIRAEQVLKDFLSQFDEEIKKKAEQQYLHDSVSFESFTSQTSIEIQEFFSYCRQENSKEVQQFIKNKKDIILEADKNDQNKTGLMISIQNQSDELIKLFFDREFIDSHTIQKNLQLTDTSIQTALHKACQFEQRNAVSLILKQKGYNINAKDFLGQTPFFIACMKGNTSIAKILIQQKYCNINEKNHKGITPLQIAYEKGHKSIVNMIKKFRNQFFQICNQRFFYFYVIYFVIIQIIHILEIFVCKSNIYFVFVSKLSKKQNTNLKQKL